MPYVKLDAGILDSTLWVEDAVTCKVFITMLAMCKANGMCESTAPGIARRANVSLEEARKAIETLEAPDPDSRSVEDDGRRVKRVDGGYLVVNYQKYRDKDHTNAERQRRFRERTDALQLAEQAEQDAKSFSEDWKEIVAFYDGKCAYCESLPWVDVDHVFPTSKGGPHASKNVVPACKSCNSAKRDSAPIGKWEPKRKHSRLNDFYKEVTDVTRYITPPFASASVSKDQKIVTPDGVDPQAWADICAYRSIPENRKAWGWSDLAQAKMAKVLSKYSPSAQREMVDKAIRNGWRGVWVDQRTDSEKVPYLE